MVRTINARLFRVRCAFSRSMLVEADNLDELARFCAGLSVEGHNISSVVEIFAGSSDTPRVPIASTPVYKQELKNLLAAKGDA